MDLQSYFVLEASVGVGALGGLFNNHLIPMAGDIRWDAGGKQCACVHKTNIFIFAYAAPRQSCKLRGNTCIGIGKTPNNTQNKTRLQLSAPPHRTPIGLDPIAIQKASCHTRHVGRHQRFELPRAAAVSQHILEKWFGGKPGRVF